MHLTVPTSLWAWLYILAAVAIAAFVAAICMKLLLFRLAITIITRSALLQRLVPLVAREPVRRPRGVI